MGLKIPAHPGGVKLKDTPAEYRAMLALVMLNQNKNNTLNLEAASKMTHISVADWGAAMASLLKREVVQLVKARTPVEFDFSLPAEVTKTLNRAASDYRAHLKALEEQLARRALQKRPALAKILPEHREPHMKRAAELAALLTRDHLAVKIADCIVRIGEPEVASIVNKTLKNISEAGSISGLFFTLYVERRKQLIGQ